MANRRRALDEASQRWARQSVEIAADLRNARVALGLTQADVGRALGRNRNHVSQIERRKLSAWSLADLARHAGVVGLRLSVKLYPVGGALRDAAQLRYVTRFVARVGQRWRVRLDVPMPIMGDLRAVDVLLDGVCLIAVEVVTRLFDVQALIRAAQLKQRDVGAQRLVIVVAATRANRHALNEAWPALATTFDFDTQRTMARLAAGQDPGRDAIVVLSA